MPLPPGYVLNADGQPFVFHQCCDLNKIGNTIRIKPYKEPDLLNFEVLRDFKIGHLTIVTVASTYTRNPVTLTYMHDGKTKLTIVGDDEVWIDRMAKACMDNPVWQPPPDFHFEQLDPH